MEPAAECMLVLIGATPEGKKELVGFQTGVRESAQSWRELLIDIKQRGLEIAPDLAVGDGALGFWKAIEEVFPGARHQRCWVHKTPNVLNKVALSVQVNMKPDLREIYGAPTRAAPEAALELFADKYGTRYDKAVACLTKDREALLAFFDFPAEHWDHLRTSNPIESVFATVRHRTVRTKGALSGKTAKLMVFKLVNAAAKTWRRLKGENQLPKVVQGVRFQNGIEVIELTAQTPPDQPRHPYSCLGPVHKLLNRLLIELDIGFTTRFDTVCCGGDRYRTDQRGVFGGGPFSRATGPSPGPGPGAIRPRLPPAHARP